MFRQEGYLHCGMEPERGIAAPRGEQASKGKMHPAQIYIEAWCYAAGYYDREDLKSVQKNLSRMVYRMFR